METFRSVIAWCILVGVTCWAGWIAHRDLSRAQEWLRNWKRKRAAERETVVDFAQDAMEQRLAQRDDIILMLYLYLLSSAEHDVEIPEPLAAHLEDGSLRGRARVALNNGHILGEDLEEIDREALRDLARDHYVDHGGVQGPSQPVGDA